MTLNRNIAILFRDNTDFRTGYENIHGVTPNSLKEYTRIVQVCMKWDDRSFVTSGWNWEYLAGLAFHYDLPQHQRRLFVKAAHRHRRLKNEILHA